MKKAKHTEPTVRRRSTRGSVLDLPLAIAAAMVVLISPAANGSFICKPASCSPPRFDRVARLSADGQEIVVSGPYICDRGDGNVEIQVSVLQDSTSASVTGRFQARCTGQLEQFVIEAIVPANQPAFAEGPAAACGFGQTFKGEGQQPTGTAEHFCAFITLER